MTRFSLRLLCISVLSAFTLATPMWAQSTLGAVSGTIRDQSSAVVPNAAVVLTNTATNNSLDTNSNGAGFYIFPDVVAGAYHLTVQSPGMQKYEGSFTVRVTERVVIDPVLTPGQTATTVEVKDITPLVTTDNPTASTTLEQERINQLPMNGRSLTNMLANIPGYESAY